MVRLEGAGTHKFSILTHLPNKLPILRPATSWPFISVNQIGLFVPKVNFRVGSSRLTFAYYLIYRLLARSGYGLPQ